MIPDYVLQQLVKYAKYYSIFDFFSWKQKKNVVSGQE
jgi:hypothetical protein